MRYDKRPIWSQTDPKPPSAILIDQFTAVAKCVSGGQTMLLFREDSAMIPQRHTCAISALL
jgi:hypothetical protein